MDIDPILLLTLVMRVQVASQVPEVLAGVIEIENLNCAGEVLVGDIPDPYGAIADNDFLDRTVPASVPGFQIKAIAKLLGRFNRSDEGGRILVADGAAFLVPCGLREYASQLDLARVGRLPRNLALAARSFPFRYGYSCTAISMYRTGNGLTVTTGNSNRAVLSISCCARGDIGSDCLRRAFHGLGGHVEIGQ